MDVSNQIIDEHTRSLADQLINSRLGQWAHTPGVETILRVKFLTKESDLVTTETAVENLGAFTAEERRLTMETLNTLEKETGLRFRIVEDGPAELTFGNYIGLKKGQWRHAELFGYADIYKVNPNPLKENSSAVSNGNFSGPIPIWIMSLATLEIDKFRKTLAHEIGHALGLAHLTPRTQEQTDGSIMGNHMLKQGAFYQANNGFADADILALREMYSLDKDKPLELFHKGSVYYGTSDGHAKVSPASCTQFGFDPKDIKIHNTDSAKSNRIVRLRKGLTQENIKFTLLESMQGIKLTFTGYPDASLIITKRSEPLIHNEDAALRFKKIKLASGQTLSIDDQLYQTLKDGKQPLWQEGRSAATYETFQVDDFGIESFEFTITDKKNDSVIKYFSLNRDRLVIPELAGRQLHILAKGEKLSPHKRNEKNVIFRQREWVYFNQEINGYNMEFVLIYFNEQGSSSKVFIEVDQQNSVISHLYSDNKVITDKNLFLQRESLEKVYQGLGLSNMDIQQPLTKSANKDIHSLSAAIVSLPLHNEGESVQGNSPLSGRNSNHHLTSSSDINTGNMYA